MLDTILFIVYISAGWWAANQLIFNNRIMIGDWFSITLKKFMCAFVLGWILIPIALIKSRLEK